MYIYGEYLSICMSDYYYYIHRTATHNRPVRSIKWNGQCSCIIHRRKTPSKAGHTCAARQIRMCHIEQPCGHFPDTRQLWLFQYVYTNIDTCTYCMYTSKVVRKRTDNNQHIIHVRCVILSRIYSTYICFVYIIYIHYEPYIQYMYTCSIYILFLRPYIQRRIMTYSKQINIFVSHMWHVT